MNTIHRIGALNRSYYTLKEMIEIVRVWNRLDKMPIGRHRAPITII